MGRSSQEPQQIFYTWFRHINSELSSMCPAGEGSVGATSAQVDSAGFGSGPSCISMTDVGRQQREQADPALQRGQATKKEQ